MRVAFSFRSLGAPQVGATSGAGRVVRGDEATSAYSLNLGSIAEGTGGAWCGSPISRMHARE
jgi:hypothetical protein